MVKAGRKLTLDPRRSKKILKAISHGLTLKRAALCAGVTYSTLSRWLRKGRRDDRNGTSSVFRSFYLEVRKADAAAEDAQAAMILKTAKKVWTAAAWWLERKYPERWGRRDGVQIKGKFESEATVIAGSRTALPTPQEIMAKLVEVLGEEQAMMMIQAAARQNGAETQKRLESNGHGT